VSLGDDDEGDEIWSCVIDPVGDYVKPVVMPKAAPLVLQALREAVAANDDSVDLDTWRKAAMKKNITDGKTERARQKMFSKCVEALIQSKKAIEDAGQYDFA
jgi:hypothetical protein